MRKARSDIIANVFSVGAWGRLAGCGLYCASKWAASGFSESLHEELKEFGINVCTIEPSYFRSKFLSPEMKKIGDDFIEDHEGSEVKKGGEMLNAYSNKQPRDIKKGAKVMIDIPIEKEKPVPLRLVLGQESSEAIRTKSLETIGILDEWKEVSCSTNLDEP